MKSNRLVLLALLTITVLAPPAARGDEAGDPGATDGADRAPAAKIDPKARLGVDSRLQKNVDFWVHIYSKYGVHQGLVHDGKYIDHVYELIDLRAPGGRGSAKSAKRKWREVLLSLHRKQGDPEAWARLSEDERKVVKLYEDIHEPNKYLNAAHRKRLRFQLGQRERFLEGLVASGRYLPAMEETFRKEGMPTDLTRLPFVESSFNVRARSKVGASGIWQFMRSTGQLFIQVNDAVDERNDPLRAAEAAAKLLKSNYESLGAWPIAVTAYNHGRKGMMRAVRKVGSTRLEDIVADYHARTFGFASSNFFVELVAVIEVERNAEKYFGPVERAKPVDGVEVQLPDFVALADLCQFLKLERKTVLAYNPALTEAVRDGQLLIPAGYMLRLPVDTSLKREAQARVFLAGYNQIPDVYKLREQRRSPSAAPNKGARKGRSYATRKRPRRQSM